MRLLHWPFVFSAVLVLSSGSVATQSPRHHPKKHPAKKVHKPSGWQPGGPLTPLYRSAVAAVHARQFDQAETLCRKGLTLAPGDKAFLDLQAQIPQWRKDTHESTVSAQYQKAVELVHEGKLDDAEEACRVGLGLDAGNRSFEALLKDIESRRNVALQNYLLKCYQQATVLMNQGHYREAEGRCKEGLAKSPDDPQLKSLLKLIRKRRAEA